MSRSQADPAAVPHGARIPSDEVGGVAPRLPSPPSEISEPGTFLFTPERALNGSALNRFALSLRWPENRAAFREDHDAYGAVYGLTAEELAMIRDRDWSGLLRHGGHLQAMLKLAVTLGEDLWHIGAHSVGCSRDDLFAAGARPIAGLPRKPDTTGAK